MEKLSSRWTDFHEFDTVFFENMSRKAVSLKSYKNNGYFKEDRGTRWRSLLRHCATSRVVGSIPDGVTDNPSGRNMALVSTQPLTEMSTRNISRGIKATGA